MVTRFYDSVIQASLAKSLNGQHLERGDRVGGGMNGRGLVATSDDGSGNSKTYDPDLLAARYQAHETCLSAFDGLFAASLERWRGTTTCSSSVMRKSCSLR